MSLSFPCPTLRTQSLLTLSSLSLTTLFTFCIILACLFSWGPISSPYHIHPSLPPTLARLFLSGVYFPILTTATIHFRLHIHPTPPPPHPPHPSIVSSSYLFTPSSMQPLLPPNLSFPPTPITTPPFHHHMLAYLFVFVYVRTLPSAVPMEITRKWMVTRRKLGFAGAMTQMKVGFNTRERDFVLANTVMCFN